MTGKISLTPPPAQLLHEQGQLEQVLGPEPGPAGGQHEERVGTIDVRPARRQRAHASLSRLSVEDPVLAPGVGVPDQLELTPLERVERMGYTESLRIAATVGS